jgi:glycosyltransferase involved in cell wall biosynthesis
VPAAEALALRNGGRTSVVLAAGRLIDLKRFDTFIEVMKRVVAQIDAVGVICGDGPLMPALKAQAQAAGIADRIVFAGFVAGIGGWMKAADVVVGLSLHEGRPNVVIEAMACGTPLVVVEIPEYLEVVDATRARIVPRDETTIAAAIIETIRDREAAVTRAAAARAVTEAWSLSAVAASHASIYETLAPRRKGP